MSSENEKPALTLLEQPSAPSEVEILHPRQGLTAAQELFARLYCQGYSQGDAHALAYPNDMDDKTHRDTGSEMLRHPGIVSLCKDLLKAAKLEEIDNPQAAFRDLMQDIDGARADKNWGAVMAGHDKRLKAWGMLKERQIHEKAETLTDKQLIDELAGDDKDKRALIGSMIGYKDGA